MADICKCRGEDCSIKETCYRYIVEPNPLRQSYFNDSPIKNGQCDVYWKYTFKDYWETNKEKVLAEDELHRSFRHKANVMRHLDDLNLKGDDE